MKVPSIVVIQERHVRHGENFKIFRVSCRSRREYIARFMSNRRKTYRCKSRKVRIGCGFKETTYKGSPLAVSRLLFLEGLEDGFPTCEQLKKMETDKAKAILADSTTRNPSLSFFNLSDQRSGLASSSSLELPGPSNGYVASTSQTLDISIAEKNCSPDSIADFNLIFGSDTHDAEDFDSDNDNQEKMSVEIDYDPTTPDPSSQIDKATGNQEANKIMVSLERMEKDIKQIVNVVGTSQNKDSSDQEDEEDVVPSNSQQSKNVPDPKPSLSVPPVPHPVKRKVIIGPHPSNFLRDIQLTSPSTMIRGQLIPPIGPRNPDMNRPFPLQPRNGQQAHYARNPGIVDNQISSRNSNSSRGMCGIVEPTGSIPVFTVPGGCFMVIHATSRTTPLLHATFVTGCSNGLQYQQTQLPVFGAHQIVAIHLGPYRLAREEINGVFTFANATRVYDSCNPPPYK